MATLSAEEREKIVNELNRVAVGYLGYQKEKTAQAVGEVDKHEKKRTKNKMAENHQRNGVRDPDRRCNRTCI